jgi:hypothetical protein
MKKGKAHGFPNLVFGGAFFKKLPRGWDAESHGHGVFFSPSLFFCAFGLKRKGVKRCAFTLVSRPNLVFGGAFFKKLPRCGRGALRETAFLFCKAFFFVPFAAKKKAPNRYRLRYFVGTGPLRKKRLCQNGKAVRFKKENPPGRVEQR